MTNDNLQQDQVNKKYLLEELEKIIAIIEGKLLSMSTQQSSDPSSTSKIFAQLVFLNQLKVDLAEMKKMFETETLQAPSQPPTLKRKM